MLLGHQTHIERFKKLADKKQLSHSYLYFGAPRVGKHLFAVSLANYLERGTFEKPTKVLSDMFVVERGEENATIGINQARAVKRFLFQRPNRSAYRTAIINDAERLTSEAQNALLKIAEEPPPSSLLFVVTHAPDTLRATLTSRLQGVYFARLPTRTIAVWLIEEYRVAKNKAQVLAAQSHGQPGLAVFLLNDARLKEVRELAHQFLATPESKRKVFLKALLGSSSSLKTNLSTSLGTSNDSFDLKLFCETLMLSLPVDRAHTALWHHLLRLYEALHSFPLNPRLQLMYLWTKV